MQTIDQALEAVTAGAMTASDAAKLFPATSWRRYEPRGATAAAYWTVLALVPKTEPVAIRTVSDADIAAYRAAQRSTSACCRRCGGPVADGGSVCGEC